MVEYIIPIVAVVATVASTTYSIVSSQQAKSEAASERRKARRAMVQDETERRRRVIASQLSKYGASGLSLEGSPLLLEADTIANSEENLSRSLDISSYYGKVQDRQYESQQVASAGQGVSSTYNIGKSYNWWQ